MRGSAFWNVQDPSKDVQVRLHDERYDELAVEVVDPDAAVAVIEEAIGNREDR